MIVVVDGGYSARQDRPGGSPAAGKAPAETAAGTFRVKVACDRECLAGFMTRYLEALVAVANSHFTGLEADNHDGSVARYSRTLDRKMVDVRPMLRQPYSSMIAEIFKIEEGRIRRIEALLTTVPYGMESGW